MLTIYIIFGVVVVLALGMYVMRKKEVEDQAGSISEKAEQVDEEVKHAEDTQYP